MDQRLVNLESTVAAVTFWSCQGNLLAMQEINKLELLSLRTR